MCWLVIYAPVPCNLFMRLKEFGDQLIYLFMCTPLPDNFDVIHIHSVDNYTIFRIMYLGVRSSRYLAMMIFWLRFGCVRRGWLYWVRLYWPLIHQRLITYIVFLVGGDVRRKNYWHIRIRMCHAVVDIIRQIILMDCTTIMCSFDITCFACLSAANRCHIQYLNLQSQLYI